MTGSRRWTLARYPAGKLAESDFALLADGGEPPALQPGEVQVRNRMFAVAPTIRNWLRPASGWHRAAVPLGGAIRGMAACEVVASADPGFAVGTRMIAMSEWADRSVIRPAQAPVPVFQMPEGMDFAEAMGPLSLNSLTAYFGLLEVGRPRAGETVVVSGAAGSVGSVVCQIARITGCRVIGIAGGAEKCARVLAVGKADAAIDYRADDVGQRLRELCPGGIDIFFDNVGGDQLRAALGCMAPHGRIVACGQISTYDRGEAAETGLDMMKVVYGRIRIEGFVVGDYVGRAEEARKVLAAWVRSGDLEVSVDLRSGLEALPRALVDLFSGANRGTVLVVND
ncbi:MAG: NADP-dependent oxidoreductase [Erythrobacter sp.]|uniref:NADP-dependent oxidoreductase n=1 Tax=Erythrobacter sp. TaxID=1042 RepID=UPI0025DD236D|nr:NADP-dependent oxidoreductase [Erythrobacter sp.]MCL9998786.1 NADP-dependent oxidoreductase [Erythrobacter sp.]